jgi:hypothetical protein
MGGIGSKSARVSAGKVTEYVRDGVRIGLLTSLCERA